ncbi:hypothetical protein WJX72_006800 [[Myrmecia] bisecta]|uniref:Uncharacterized protein n=1 Tax=[Myrmecia] bisecta TaxID=41462 RepID=A0AAW1PLA0_9CHLO
MPPAKAKAGVADNTDPYAAPDVATLIAALTSQDAAQQQQALQKLLVMQDCPAVVAALASEELLSLVASQLSTGDTAGCLLAARATAHLATWPGRIQRMLCQQAHTQALWGVVVEHQTRLAAAASTDTQAPSAESLEAVLRALTATSLAAEDVTALLAASDASPFVALLGHVSPVVQDRTCRLIGSLARSPDLCQALVHVGAARNLAALAASGPLDLRELACRALAGLARGPPSIQAALVELDIVGVMVRLCADPDGQPEGHASMSDAAMRVQEAASEALLPPLPRRLAASEAATSTSVGGEAGSASTGGAQVAASDDMAMPARLPSVSRSSLVHARALQALACMLRVGKLCLHLSSQAAAYWQELAVYLLTLTPVEPSLAAGGEADAQDAAAARPGAKDKAGAAKPPPGKLDPKASKAADKKGNGGPDVAEDLDWSMLQPPFPAAVQVAAVRYAQIVDIKAHSCN